MNNTGSGPILPQKIGILLMPGYSMLALFAIIEPLRLTNQLTGRRHYSWIVFTADGKPAHASCGMATAAMELPQPALAPDCVFAVAGFDPWPQDNRQLKSWLRALDRRGSALGAVDTGSFLLASAGLLNEVPTALHWEAIAAFSELFPDVLLSDRLFELHHRRFLCAGGSATIDMMLNLVEREHGHHLSNAIARRLNHARRLPHPSATTHHPSGLLDGNDEVRRITKMMEQHIEDPIRITDIANGTALSQRSLERKCRQFFGRTPKQVYLDLRLEKARQFLRHSDVAVRDVALSCGFVSIPYFCRAYKARFGTLPSKDRTFDRRLVSGPEAVTNSGKLLADLGNDVLG